MPRFLSGFALTLCIALCALEAHAVNPFGFAVSPNDVAKYRKPISVLGEARPSLSTGAYTIAIPLALPPARNGLVPPLALTYNSNLGGTNLGQGWEIPTAYVRRSTKYGVPRYVGPLSSGDHQDTFEYRFGGHSGELVWTSTDGSKFTYRPKREGLFARFVYDSAADTWRVYEQSGLTSVLGDQEHKTGFDTYAWHVETTNDPHGNNISYTYARRNGGVFLTQVSYDRCPYCQPTDVDLTWTDNASPKRLSYHKGYRTEFDARLLDQIKVTAYDESGATGPDATLTYTIDLAMMHAEGRPNVETITAEGLPETRLSYHAPTTQFTENRTLSGSGLPGADDQYNLEVIRLTHDQAQWQNKILYRTVAMLVDMDGDGDLDGVRVKAKLEGYSSDQWEWRKNENGVLSTTYQPLTIPTQAFSHALRYEEADTPSTIHNVRLQDLADMNGDGKVDLVVNNNSNIYLCKNIGGDFASSCTPMWTSSGPAALPYSLATTKFYGFSKVDIAALLDMNGDGLPDYVRQEAKVGPGRLKGVVYLSDGQAFAATSIPFDNAPICESVGESLNSFCLRWYQNDSYGSRVLMDHRDMNGDRIPDELLYFTSTNKVEINWGKGDGLSSDNTTIDSVKIGFTTQLANPTTTGSELAGIYDINNDGLPDFVTTEYDQGALRLKVRINNGNGAFAKRTWYTNVAGGSCSPFSQKMRVVVLKCMNQVPCSGTKWSKIMATKQLLTDFDGDGQLDLLTGYPSYTYYDPTSQSNPINPSWCLSTVPAKPSYRVTKVESGNAATTELEYALPTRNANAIPFPYWSVSQIKRTDRGTGWTETKKYEAYDPDYDADDHAFLGFYKSRMDDNGKRWVYRYFRQDEWGFGKLKHHVIKDHSAEENLLREVYTDFYDQSFDSGKRHWIRPNKVHSKTHYGSNVEASTVEYEYFTEEALNELGLLKAKKNLGFDDESADTRTDTFEYFVKDDPTLLMVRTKKETRTDHNGTKEAETEYLYDDMCDIGGLDLLRGHPCRKRVWRGTGESPADYKYSYGPLGRLEQTISPDDEVTNTSYYGYSKYVSSVQNSLGHTTYYSDYHALSGKAGRICGPQYISNPQADKCDAFSFDKYGRLTERKAALDYMGGYATMTVEQITYADHSVPTAVVRHVIPDPINNLVPEGEERTYFDLDGRVVLEARWVDANWSKRYFAYDKLGNLEKAWYPRYEGTDAYNAPTTSSFYTYQHDLLNRLTKTIDPGCVSAPQNCRRATYAKGKVTVTDQTGLAQEFVMTAHGEVYKRRYQGETVYTQFHYDGAGRLDTAWGPSPSGVVQPYMFDYFGDGTLDFAQMPTGTLDYDRSPGGRLTRETRSNGAVIDYTYDLIGRTDSRTVSSHGGTCPALHERAEVYTYDVGTENLGYLMQVDAPEYSYLFMRDALGRVVGKTLDYHESEMSYGQQLTVFGQPIRVDYPSGRQLNFVYNSGQQPVYISDFQDIEVGYAYYADGSVSEANGILLQQGSTFKRKRQLDATKRLWKLKTTFNENQPNQQLWEATYAYWDNDKIKKIIDPFRGTSYEYEYSATNGKLFKAKNYPGALPGTTGDVGYSYNLNGSLSSVTNGPSAPSETYSYKSSKNQLVDTIMNGSSTLASYDYDSFGQRCGMSTSAFNRSYTWTGDGVLASMTQAGDVASFESYFRYDHTGHRWRKYEHDDSGERLTWYLDDLAEVSEVRGGLEESVKLGAGIRCTFAESNEKRCYFKDHLSTAVVMDGAGQVVSKSSYYPYGTRISHMAGEAPKYEFNDKRKEKNGDLLYYGARYYDPVARVFVSSDPLRWVGAEDTLLGTNSLQPFVYVNGDPVNLGDPTGTCPVEFDLSDLGSQISPAYNTQSQQYTTHELRPGWTVELWNFQPAIGGVGRVGQVARTAGRGLIRRIVDRIRGLFRTGPKTPKGAAKTQTGAGKETKAVTTSPTAGKKVDAKTRQRILARDQKPDGSWDCATCGQNTTNPSNIHTGHIKPRSHGGDLSNGNLRCEGAACNLSQGNRPAPKLGRTCKDRGSCGAPYRRTD